jgi:hypothetical protein
VLAAVGLTAQDVARRVTEWAAALPGARIGVTAGRSRPRRLDTRELEGFDGGRLGAGGLGAGRLGSGELGEQAR